MTKEHDMWLEALTPLSDETLKSIATGEIFVVQAGEAMVKTNKIAELVATNTLFKREELRMLRAMVGPTYTSSIVIRFGGRRQNGNQ